MRQIEAQLIHDMRNAVSVIQGAADTLHASARTMSPENVEHVAGMLARRSDMLVRLLGDLAIVHEIDRGDLGLRLQSVNVSEVVRDYVTTRMDPREATVVVEVDPHASVIADRVRLLQILDNLVSNAARYGGPNVVLRSSRDAHMVRIEVSDDGPGVAPELVDTLFDLYSRGSRSQELGGSGLGLAIVQELCEAMGGSASYEHTTGTTFSVSLPAVQEGGALPLVDPAGAGHAVSFWVADTDLADAVADYAAIGLAAGEAVMIAVTPEHLVMIEERLVARGLDLDISRALGQYIPLDAEELADLLERDGHVDPDRFSEIIGTAVRTVDDRWQGFRVFGEIVDVYWRCGNGHLALELETCWNRLRTQVDFPLYCGYQITAAQDRVCDCHDAVLVA